MGTLGGISYSDFNLTSKRSISSAMPAPPLVMQKLLAQDTFEPSISTGRILFASKKKTTKVSPKEKYIGDGCESVVDLIKRGRLVTLKKKYEENQDTWNLADMYVSLGNQENLSLTHIAAKYPTKRTIGIIRWLHEQNLPLNAPNKADGRKPIHTAAANGNFNAVRALLHYNVKVDQEDTNGLTPLGVALQERAFTKGPKGFHIIWSLLAGGADIDKQMMINQKAQTPCSFLQEEGYDSQLEQMKKLHEYQKILRNTGAIGYEITKSLYETRKMKTLEEINVPEATSPLNLTELDDTGSDYDEPELKEFYKKKKEYFFKKWYSKLQNKQGENKNLDVKSGMKNPGAELEVKIKNPGTEWEDTNLPQKPPANI